MGWRGGGGVLLLVLLPLVLLFVSLDELMVTKVRGVDDNEGDEEQNQQLDDGDQRSSPSSHCCVCACMRAHACFVRLLFHFSFHALARLMFMPPSLAFSLSPACQTLISCQLPVSAAQMANFQTWPAVRGPELDTHLLQPSRPEG